jgi:hypothetical protein
VYLMMKKARVRFFALSLILAVAALCPATAGPGSGMLYGSDGYSSNTLIIDPATGASVVLGPAGVSSTPALAMDPMTGILYGGEGGGNPNLYTVNTDDGSWSLVAPVIPGCGNTNLGYSGISDMDFHPDGTLYAAVNVVGTNGTGGDHLAILDKHTGLATLVGAFGSCWRLPPACRTLSTGSCSIDGISGLAFDADGNLWAARNKGGELGLYQVDLATGAATFHAPLLDAAGNPPAGGVVSMRFGCDGTLYGGTTRTNNQSLNGGFLLTIDAQTGLFTQVSTESATGGTGLGGLAFSGGCECDPDTEGPGYWNRQCLGAGLLVGGREPRGPQGANEANFGAIHAAVSQTLTESLGEQDACLDGMVADPMSNACERAKRMYTAVLFNLESGRLQGSCGLDSTEGSGSTDVSSSVLAMAAMINSGDAVNCRDAAHLATLINEGEVFLESEVAVEAVPTTEVPEQPTPPAAAVLPAGSSSVPESPAVQDVEPEMAETSDLLMAMRMEVAPEVPSPVAPATEPSDDDDVARIHRHLAVLGNPAAPESATVVSVDELLTTLSGGYELELRLQVAGVLVSRIDDSLSSLLVAHLHHMRMEAQELDLPHGVQEVEALLARLLPGEAVAER